MDTYEKKYKQAVERAKALCEDGHFDQIALEELFPELKESEDEKIRKDIVFYIAANHKDDGEKARWLYWLENQGKQEQLSMIQWTGDNLKDVIAFTGKSPDFDKWFKSEDEYVNYVKSHNNIFKIFNKDGSHREVPVGAWIIRTPDGYNVPSRGGFVPKHSDCIEKSNDTRQKPNELYQQPNNKRKNVLNKFYALLFCLLFVTISVVASIITCKMFGWTCNIERISFGMVVSIIWWLYYNELKDK